jgi:hypothetical protein
MPDATSALSFNPPAYTDLDNEEFDNEIIAA